jgi:hypothetical protein
MFLCRECGNKRCPHSTDCNLACTKSNDPEQEGSRYHSDWINPFPDKVDFYLHEHVEPTWNGMKIAGRLDTTGNFQKGFSTIERAEYVITESEIERAMQKIKRRERISTLCSVLGKLEEIGQCTSDEITQALMTLSRKIEEDITITYD